MTPMDADRIQIPDSKFQIPDEIFRINFENLLSLSVSIGVICGQISSPDPSVSSFPLA
jgi:hypothetical protein